METDRTFAVSTVGTAVRAINGMRTRSESDGQVRVQIIRHDMRALIL